MKSKIYAGLIMAGCGWLDSSLQAATTAPPPADTPASSNPGKPVVVDRTSVHAQMQVIFDRLEAKFEAGSRTEADLALDLRQFDYLLTMHRAEKTDEVANILYTKYLIYRNKLGLNDKALAALKQIMTDFPDTTVAKAAVPLRAKLEAQMALVPGKPFPEFPAGLKDLNGAAVTVAGYKGRVLLVDFWATWCAPCVAEMPSVIAIYNRYHAKGLEIVGITLDNDDADGKTKVTAFIKDHKMPWPQFYDGKGWNNVLAVQSGVEAIPASFLLGRDGKILGVSLRGQELATAVEKALGSR